MRSIARTNPPAEEAQDLQWGRAGAKRMNSDVLVHQVKIVASGSLPSLNLIDFVRMAVATPAISESTTEIMNYERGEKALSNSTIEASPSAPINITTLWSADKSIVEVQIAGQLPEQDWTVDVTLNLSNGTRRKEDQ